MTEQTTPAASDMSPDAPCRVLIAPCGCLVGGDITMSGPGFCRTRAEADEDAARGYREEVRTVAEFRAARLCGRCRMAHAGRCTARYDWTVSHRGRRSAPPRSDAEPGRVSQGSRGAARR